MNTSSLSEEWVTSLKPDLHGIRFRFWLAFFSASVGIVVSLGVLQIGFIGPYYRNVKMHSIRNIAEDIAEYLSGDATDGEIGKAVQDTIRNNACVVMYNTKGKIIFQADSLGVGCIFNAAESRKPQQLNSMETIRQQMDENGSDFSLTFESAVTDNQMMVYGTKVNAPLSTYYLFVNTSLDPVYGAYSVFLSQYFIFTIVVMLLASAFAYFYSRKITRPIVNMQKEAGKLANADYTAHFEGGSFTETQQLASTLNHANHQLQKIDTLRRDLIANLSHDIRTPLTDIRAYAEMIRDISGDRPEKREKHLNVIIRETEYLSMLINDMNQLTAMQSDNIEINEEEIDLCARINEIIELNRTLIHNAGIILHVDLPEKLYVVIDDIKIERVIQNYLSNAIKHTPSGNSITIRAYKKRMDNVVRIEVEDQGEGIKEEEIPYIWDRHYISSRTFRRNMNSTGLGLAIVKSIAETLECRYGVISHVNRGSLFYFEIPEKHR